MSIIHQLSPETIENFNELVGSALLSTPTTIRTIYVDDKEEHSGTGLIVSDEGRKYVLTANHVLTPSRRTHPRKVASKRHYHTLNLRKGEDRSKPFALRYKFWRSESLDLAMIESALSERPDFDERQDYYPAREFSQKLEFDALNDDVFVVCGFQASGITAIPAAREVNHSVLVHYFSGSDGDNDPNTQDRYRFKFDGSSYPPAGLSGAPVWLLRDRNNLSQAISADYLNERSGKELQILAIFCGIVTDYYPGSKEIAAVRRERCNAFVMQAMEKLPSLRIKEEDEWIADELNYLKERTWPAA